MMSNQFEWITGVKGGDRKGKLWVVLKSMGMKEEAVGENLFVLFRLLAGCLVVGCKLVVCLLAGKAGASLCSLFLGTAVISVTGMAFFEFNVRCCCSSYLWCTLCNQGLEWYRTLRWRRSGKGRC